MANVAYSGVPESVPQGAPPEDYQHEQASAGAFGAGIAAGAEAVGESLTKDANIYGQVAADNATNNTLQSITNSLYGDPTKKVLGPGGVLVPDTGYFGLRGDDAMRARADIAKHIDAVIAENGRSLDTPLARQAYEADTRRYRAQWEREIGAHADNQQRVWTIDTNNTSIEIQLNTLARAPTDPSVVARVTDAVRQAMVRNAQLNGLDAAGAVLKADQQVALMQVQALLPTDPVAAQRLLDEKKGLLASTPGYDGLVDRVQLRARDVTAHAVADNALIPRGRVTLPPARTISEAILGQESGGGANTATSVTGAVGAYQIQPDTFAHYAKPGEIITNPADNARVGQRIIADLEHKYPNDPARVAVAYFSGQGNVSAPGSPTPWLADRRDPTGKSVSSYVSDIRARLAGSAAGTPQSGADYYRQNFTAIEDKARQDYLARYPNDVDGADRAASLADTKMRAAITQDEMRIKADYHALDAAASKPGANGQLPITVDQLLQNHPELRTGWENLQLSNPYAAANFENHLLKANAMPANTTYGNDFYNIFNKVLSGEVKSPDQLLPEIDASKGDSSRLTKEGYGQLKTMMGALGTPQGTALARAEQNFFRNARHQLTLTNEANRTVDKAGDVQFNRFMVAAMSRINADLASGKTPEQLFDPKSPDYVGKLIPSFDRPLAQKTAAILAAAGNMSLGDLATATQGGTQGGNGTTVDMSTPAGLKAAVAAGAIDREKAIELAIKNHWIAPPPPPVPTPH